MIRALIVTAAAGAICLCLAPVAAADLPQIGPAMSGPYFGISPEPPASPLSVDNAVQAAENYLSMMPFSYKGLIQQLVMGDGYSTADATSAVNSITVDWNQQAVKAAQNYLSMMPFSRQGLIQQLVMGDGYTPSQAAYGVAATGL